MTRVIIATSDWTSWPGFAGATWVPIQYVIGLLRLGVDVTWVDLLRCVDPRRDPHSVDYLMARFEATARDFGFAGSMVRRVRRRGAHVRAFRDRP